MHIILVSNRLATAKSWNISLRRLVAAALGLVLLVLVLALALSWFGVVGATGEAHTVAVGQAADRHEVESQVKDKIGAMAVKLGEIQAKVMRLDSLGDRVSRLSGLPAPKPDVRNKPAPDGQGGPLIPTRPLSMEELQLEISRLADNVEESTDALTALESQLMERRIKSTLLPSLAPIEYTRIGSPFGRRIDPLAGVMAMHEGLDFIADVGTPVLASAGGVVQTAEFHPQYGYLIEIDHGRDFSSRYAHLSKIQVKPGQVVKRGQLIGASGNTGRSTGPHLHFEVRYRGVAQDPARFLPNAPMLAVSSANFADSVSDGDVGVAGPATAVPKGAGRGR